MTLTGVVEKSPMDKELAAAQVFEDFLRTIIEKIHILVWSYLWVAYCDVQPNRLAGGSISPSTSIPMRALLQVLPEQTSGRL
jgi:hypothetical protein